MTLPRRPETRSRAPEGSSEEGFALVLALLALMLLTFLGLTLATSTSTELRIATNYRWQQQALYNAEAGVEAGKSLLRGMNWGSILPAARTASSWDGNTNPSAAGGGATAPQSRNDQWGNATRNFESWNCDQRGNGAGYGVVLDDGGSAAPYQYKTTVLGQTLQGAFTLWVRRPTLAQPNGTVVDYAADSDHLMLVSEGVAPYAGGVLSNARVAGNAAVQVVEVLLSRASGTTASACGTRTGQAGQGPEGAGFAACDPITGAGLAAALGGSFTDRGVQ